MHDQRLKDIVPFVASVESGSFAAAAASLSTEHSGGIPSIREKDAVLKAMG